MTIGIYKITNTENERIYIGGSKDIDNRWQQHINDLKNNKHHSWRLQNDFNQMGVEKFNFEVIEEIKDLRKITSREQYWMDHYSSYSDLNYNISKVAFSKQSTNIVKIPRNIIEMKYNISILEMRILYFGLLKLTKTRKNYIKIFVYEFKEKYKVKSNTIYDELRKGCTLLNNLKIIDSCNYNDKDKSIEIIFEKKFAKEIFALKEDCVCLNIDKNIHYIKNKYTFKMYQLMKKHSDKKTYNLEIEYLRDFLDIKSSYYPLYGNFKHKILNPVIDEINKYTDLTLRITDEYSTSENKKSIDTIKINIKAKL